MFTKAHKPESIRVTVIQQNDPDNDPDCLETYCERMKKEGKEVCPFRDQVYIHQIYYKEAMGPMWARGVLSKDFEAAHERNEMSQQDFCMSIDSHMDFEPNFDRSMVDMWDDAQNEYAVLSTYVTATEELGKDKEGKKGVQVPHLCMVTFTTNVRVTATKCANNLVKPKLTNAIFGAGLSFAKCHAELKAPVDPHSEHIFDGEEFNRAARLWTNGYDIYTPNHIFVLHDYHKSQSNPTTSTWHNNRDNSQAEKRSPTNRLLTIIDVPGGEKDPQKALELKQSKYGLGDRRTLDQLIQFSGIDLRNRRGSIDGKNRCGNLQWVPFVEHPKGVNYIPKYDNITEKRIDPYDETSTWYDPASIQSNSTAEEDMNLLLLKNPLHLKHASLAKELEGSNENKEDDGKIQKNEAMPHLEDFLHLKHALLAKELEDTNKNEKEAGKIKEDNDVPNLDKDFNHLVLDKLQNRKEKKPILISPDKNSKKSHHHQNDRPNIGSIRRQARFNPENLENDHLQLPKQGSQKASPFSILCIMSLVASLCVLIMRKKYSNRNRLCLGKDRKLQKKRNL